MVAGAPAEPALAHLHATDDSTFNLSIQPLPSKDGRVTGTLFLTPKLIIGIHERPSNYYVQVHFPPDLVSGRWNIEGVLSLTSG
jgi:hypothetical protein